MKLFDSTVCLAISGMDLQRAISVTRDMRSVLTAIKVAMPLFTAKGLLGLSALKLLGMKYLILDLRVLSHPAEVWHTVYAAALLREPNAITVSTLAGKEALKLAVDAAEKSIRDTGFVHRPAIIGAFYPASIRNKLLREELLVDRDRTECALQAAEVCTKAGIDAMMVDYRELAAVRRHFPNMPLLATVKRPSRCLGAAAGSGMPGIPEILGRGATHVLYDTCLISGSAEDTADWIHRELKEYSQISGRPYAGCSRDG